MKLYISADMEGIAGLAEYRHAKQGSGEFQWMLDLWIDQINTIIEAAIEDGVEKVLVNEAHSGMNYINLSKLNPVAELITGYIKDDNQMEGLDESFLGAVFIGHARAGTAQAVLNHAYVMRDVYDLRLNGESIGELGLNAIWASYLGSALVMVVGDDYTAKEAKEFDDSIECAIVKRGLSQFTAHHLSYQEAKRELERATHQAIKKRAQGLIINHKNPNHYEMEIDFSISEIAHLCSFIPTVDRVGPRTVRFENSDFRELQHTRIVCTNLALAVARSHFA